jgi:FAD/FMN-containing dehydrogenase
MLRTGALHNGSRAIRAAASQIMKQEWTNWSGSLRFTPEIIEHPEDEDSLALLVRRAADQKKKVRVVGAGHSSMPLVATEHILVSMEKFKGVVSHDKEAGEVTIRTGMTLAEAGEEFEQRDLALHNYGDVNLQAVVGAVGTGTHGTTMESPTGPRNIPCGPETFARCIPSGTAS